VISRWPPDKTMDSEGEWAVLLLVGDDWAEAHHGPAADELTTPSSARRLPVSAIVKVMRVDHPVSPCC
jgi:hypothetical protein